jgi:hypothetical protein
MAAIRAFGIGVAAAIGLAPLASSAGTIDFRSAAFAGADQATSFTTSVDGVGVTLTPEPERARLYWDSTDGIGVRWDYETDEIEGVERLVVSFSTPIHVSEVVLTDLFLENEYLETGWYQIDGGDVVGFEAEADQLLGKTNGVKLLQINELVSAIRFGAPGRVGAENHEFSVAQMRFSAPVPEPSSGLLFGVGAWVLGWSLRRTPVHAGPAAGEARGTRLVAGRSDQTCDF